jgi:predicted ribosomally synthesized peptide with SipW-like signal peptide
MFSQFRGEIYLMAENSINQDNKERNKRRRRAVLAAGLVLGVGAAVTLAAWNDSVWGKADFGTGTQSWNLQGTFDDGASWDEFDTRASEGTFAFDVKAGDMAPGDVTHAVVGVKEVYGNFASTVLVKSPIIDNQSAGYTGNTLANALNVQVCDLGTTAPVNWDGTCNTPIANGKLSAVADSASTDLAKGVDSSRYYGFNVSMDQGQRPSGLAPTTSVEWEFAGQSVDNP